MKDSFLKNRHRPKQTIDHKKTIDLYNSDTVESILHLTFPKYRQFFPFRKNEILGLIHRYFNDGSEDLLTELTLLTNTVTAHNMQGHKFLFQKHSMRSFQQYDQFMTSKEANSFAMLDQTLAPSEVLEDEDIVNLFGGKKSNNRAIPHSKFQYCDPLLQKVRS